jgi:Immunity protein 10
VDLFTATFASVTTDDHVLYAGIADAPFETKRRHLLFMHGLRPPTAQDRALGHDREFVQIDGQRRGVYGGIERVRAEPDKLTVWVDERAAKKLAVGRTFVIPFGPDGVTGLDAFYAALRTILGDRFEV